VEAQPTDRGGELGQHRLHQHRVEGVGDGQRLDPPPHLTPAVGQYRDGVGGTGDDHRVGAVDRGDIDRPVELVQFGGDVGLRRGHGQHRPTGRQGLHQPAPRRHQGAGVVQVEHPGDVRGGDLTDGMPDQ
jgi:hypothetical protein